MARKRKGRVKVTRRHGWKAAKRRTVKQKTQFPLEPQIEIPEELAGSPDAFYAAPEHGGGFLNLLALAWHQAITEGLTLTIGAQQPTVLDELAGHTRGLIIYNIGVSEPLPTRDNIATLPGDVSKVVTELLGRRYEHVSFVYLPVYAGEALPLLADRLVPGSVVVLTDVTLVDFCDWAGENGREIYALLRVAQEAFVAMLAN